MQAYFFHKKKKPEVRFDYNEVTDDISIAINNVHDLGCLFCSVDFFAGVA